MTDSILDVVSLKCVKCARYAEFDSPAVLCEYHWSEWWCEGVYEEWSTMTPSAREAAIQETIENRKNPLDDEDRAAIAVLLKECQS